MYDLYGALIGNLSNYLYTYILIILLVAGGIYFTVRTKFVQFRYLKESLRTYGFDGIPCGNRKYRRRIHSNLSRRTRIIILDVAHSASGNVYCFRGGNSGSDL